MCGEKCTCVCVWVRAFIWLIRFKWEAISERITINRPVCYCKVTLTFLLMILSQTTSTFFFQRFSTLFRCFSFIFVVIEAHAVIHIFVCVFDLVASVDLKVIILYNEPSQMLQLFFARTTDRSISRSTERAANWKKSDEWMLNK